MTFSILSSSLFGLALLITGTPSDSKPVPAYALVITTTSAQKAPATLQAARKAPERQAQNIRLVENKAR